MHVLYILSLILEASPDSDNSLRVKYQYQQQQQQRQASIESSRRAL